MKLIKVIALKSTEIHANDSSSIQSKIANVLLEDQHGRITSLKRRSKVDSLNAHLKEEYPVKHMARNYSIQDVTNTFSIPVEDVDIRLNSVESDNETFDGCLFLTSSEVELIHSYTNYVVVKCSEKYDDAYVTLKLDEDLLIGGM